MSTESKIYYEELTEKDFEISGCWLLNIHSDKVSPVNGINQFNEDIPYVSYAKYKLVCGIELSGYMCAYDRSGNRVFHNGDNIPLCMYCEATIEEANSFSKKIGLCVHDIFPIEYNTVVACMGHNTGTIKVE
ncbi:hypothetical protein H0A36_26945 [Endozoicomonas sp. SM1973]|uniref:Uncharacterized protein n=1 Tax=Spartinivicinus marinus TaxID=2994442 RepID=A0A853IP49_9GAMM|nr:hypothetical protein [Spartinivicinus marinus]MCX4030516.1 hypothetical protein [Spartinivicinus marinus]NYZ69656.1 hypothetical protein [Spartinivicinus marinus]